MNSKIIISIVRWMPQNEMPKTFPFIASALLNTKFEDNNLHIFRKLAVCIVIIQNHT